MDEPRWELRPLDDQEDARRFREAVEYLRALVLLSFGIPKEMFGDDTNHPRERPHLDLDLEGPDHA